MTPDSEQYVLVIVPVLLYKIFSTNQYKHLSLMLDDPGRVKSQIASVVHQIQRLDFDRNLVVSAINRPTFTRFTFILQL